jgi:hypothetical protein
MMASQPVKAHNGAHGVTRPTNATERTRIGRAGSPLHAG